VIKNGTRNFFINFNVPDLSNGQNTDLDFHIFVQVTDTSGQVTLASFPTLLKLAGPIA